MFSQFWPLGMALLWSAVPFTNQTNSDLLIGEEETENLIQFKVLPTGSYKLIFWNKFINRFYGDLDSSKLFSFGTNNGPETENNNNSNNNKQLKFKVGALLPDKEKAISDRFFQNRLQFATAENGEFLIKESKGIRTHVTVVPLDSNGEPFLAGGTESAESDIAEQIDQLISIDNCTNPTIIRYHSTAARGEQIVQEMFDRWLFGKGNWLSPSDCFFVEAYLRQMKVHLNEFMVHTKYGDPSSHAGNVEQVDFNLYFELGLSLSRAFHSGQLADRLLMVEDAMAELRTLCVIITTFQIVQQQEKRFAKLNYWEEICAHMNELWDSVVSRAIDRWLTEGQNDGNPLKMGDANTLLGLVEDLSTQVQMVPAGANNGNGGERKKQCAIMSFSMSLEPYQANLLSTFGQKLEMARQTNAKWVYRVIAVNGILDPLRVLCQHIGTECKAPSSEWAQVTRAWRSFCPHLNKAQSVWVLETVGRWIRGEKEQIEDEQSVLELNLENLAEKMEPDSEEPMNEEDIALLHQIGLEVIKAKEGKRWAARVMTPPGLWDQICNICTLISGRFLNGVHSSMIEKWQRMAQTWEHALCGQLEDIYVNAVMNALERWRAGTTDDCDVEIIIAGNARAMRTMERVAGMGEPQQQKRGFLLKTDIVLMAQLGTYFAEAITAVQGKVGKERTKLEPIVGMDKMLRRQCNSWTEFRRNIAPENRKMFVSWSKICKIIQMKANKSERNGKMRDKVEENLMEMKEENKEKRGVKRKEEKKEN